MFYKIEIPWYEDIFTAHSITELVKALQDRQCIKRMDVQTLCQILDELEEDGIFVGKMADDNRLYFSIIRKEE